MPTVEEVLSQQHLQLRMIAGAGGLERELEWAHSCDLPDPWTWVGERQALLTNGTSIPVEGPAQARWVERLHAAGVAAIAVGDKMAAPEIQPEFLERCDALNLPCFVIPYPLAFSAVTQAVSAAASLAQSQRLRVIAQLYDHSGRDLSEHGDALSFINTVQGLIGHDIVVIDEGCGHNWFGGGQAPVWVKGVGGVAGELVRPTHVPQVYGGAGAEIVHALPLVALPGAVAWFLPRPGFQANQYLLLHAAAVLGAVLARHALDELQENRRRVEYLDELVREPARVASGVAAAKLGIEGNARGAAIVEGTQEERESTVRRLQRHGVRLTWTLQRERHLVVAEHPNLRSLLVHAREGGARIGLGSVAAPAELNQSLREAVWALRARPHDSGITEFAPNGSWMGFHEPAAAAHFVRATLGPLLERTAHRVELLTTLRRYLELDRSLVRTSEALVVHRQTVVQRLHRIEQLLSINLSETDAIARVWVALVLRDATI